MKRDTRRKIAKINRRLKDERNFLNMIAIHVTLEKVIGPYQIWDQKKVVSVFERKYAKELMEERAKRYKMKQNLPEFAREQLEKIDWEAKEFKKSKVKLKHVKTKEAALKKIVTTIQEVLTVFILAKKDRHLKEDLEFVDPISDLFDLRLWDQKILTRSVYEDEKSYIAGIEKFKDDIAKLCENGSAFFSDLDTSAVVAEFRTIIDSLVSSQQLGLLQRQNHIKNQWELLLGPRNFSLCPSLGKLSKRAAMCGNAAASCERENSRIDRYKSKLSSSMGIDMMTARSRLARNGPPLHLFDANESVKYWILKGHRKGSKVVDRKKREKEENFTSKVFSKKYFKI